MRKYILFLVIFHLCLGQQILANDSIYKVTVYTDEIGKKIDISSILKDIKLYGGKNIKGEQQIIGKTYGGDVFITKNKTLNKTSPIFNCIKQDKTNGIWLEFTQEILEKEDTHKLSFYGTYKDNKDGWCCNKDSIYSVDVTIEKRSIPQTSKTDTVPTDIGGNSKETITAGDTIIGVSGDTIIFKRSNDTKVLPFKDDIKIRAKEYFKNNWCSVLIVVILFALLYFHQKKLEKKISNLEARKEEPTSKSDKNEVDINNIKESIIAELQSSKKLSNDDIRNIVNHQDVKKGVINIVKKIVEEYVQKENKPVVRNNNEQTNVENETKTKTNKPNTTRNKYADFYLDENNTAVVESRDFSDNKEYGMFEIILDNFNIGSANYTINRSKEKATLEDISILSKYAEIESVPPKFNSIEVIEEGEMQQNGAYWNVTKKIKVRLI